MPKNHGKQTDGMTGTIGTITVDGAGVPLARSLSLLLPGTVPRAAPHAARKVPCTSMPIHDIVPSTMLVPSGEIFPVTIAVAVGSVRRMTTESRLKLSIVRMLLPCRLPLS